LAMVVTPTRVVVEDGDGKMKRKRGG